MAEWDTRPLSDFVDPNRSICYGIVQPGSAVSDGVPIVRVNNFIEGGIDTTNALRIDSEIEAKYRRSRLQGGELLITLVGSMGLTAIAAEELRGWNVARAVGVVPLRADADKRWINFVVRSKPAQDFILMRANTTVQATFNLKDLAELPIPCPPDGARIEMSSMLSSLDDKIELNRRMNETLEAMARAIFKDWFVDFGPTRAKMEGRAPYLAPDIWSLFPDRLDDDYKPEGWKTGTLGEVVTNIVDRRMASAETAAIPYVPIDMIEPKCLTLSNWRPGSEAQTSLVGFKKRDILFGAMRPYFHKVAIAPFEGTTRTTVFILRPLREADLAFAALLVTFESTIEFAASHSSGTTIPYAVWSGSMERMATVVPPIPIRDAFSEIIEPLIEKMRLAAEESRTLAATRDLLLPKLMSGEVRVKDAEKHVGEAT